MAPHISVGQHSRVSYSFALSLAFFLMSSVNTAASSARSAWLGGGATMQISNFGTGPSSTKWRKTPSPRLFNVMKSSHPTPQMQVLLCSFLISVMNLHPSHSSKSMRSPVAQLNSTIEWHGINCRKKQKKKEKEEQKIGYPHACWGMRHLQMRLTNS